MNKPCAMVFLLFIYNIYTPLLYCKVPINTIVHVHVLAIHPHFVHNILLCAYHDRLCAYHDTLSRGGYTGSPTWKEDPLCVHDAAHVRAVQCHLSPLNMSL